MTPIRRVDANQAEIVAALRKAGCTVQSLAALGHGVPDLLVGHAGHNYLMEVKHGAGKLTEDELRWHVGWYGAVYVVYTTEEALRVVNLLR